MNIFIIALQLRNESNMEDFVEEIEKNYQISVHYIEAQSDINRIKTQYSFQQNLELIFFLKEFYNDEELKIMNQIRDQFQKIIIIYDENIQKYNKVQNLLNYQGLNTKKCQLQLSMVQFFDYFRSYKKTQFSNQKVALFIGNEVNFRNKIFQSLNQKSFDQSDYQTQKINFDQKWLFINTSPFSTDISQREFLQTEVANLFEKYFRKIYKIFLVLQYERTDLVKSNFRQIFSYFQKFSSEIVVIFYQEIDEEFQEDIELTNYVKVLAKIKNIIYLSKKDLVNQILHKQISTILKLQEEIDSQCLDEKDTFFEAKNLTLDNKTFNGLEQLSNNFEINELEKERKSFQDEVLNIELQKQQKVDSINELQTNIMEFQKAIDELKKEKYSKEHELKQFDYKEKDLQWKIKQLDNQISQKRGKLNNERAPSENYYNSSNQRKCQNQNYKQKKPSNFEKNSNQFQKSTQAEPSNSQIRKTQKQY